MSGDLKLRMSEDLKLLPAEVVEKEVAGFFMNFSNALTESFLRSAAVLFAARSINVHNQRLSR